MSRTVVEFSEPEIFLGEEITGVAYGLDHDCGYFIQGLNGDKIVTDLDSYGFGFIGKESLKNHSNSEMMAFFYSLGMDKIARLVGLDLPI